MRKLAENYYKDLLSLINSIRATDSEANILDFYSGIEMACGLILSRANSGNKIIFIGNGASASISSHMATDFWKNGGVKAISFNDSSLLTSISNDYGFKYVFEKPIEMFTDPRDVLFAISSSGESENILRGATAAKEKGLKLITLSGFNELNPLRELGDINFYVPVSHYGYVEVIHTAICHCLIDIIISNRSNKSKSRAEKQVV